MSTLVIFREGSSGQYFKALVEEYPVSGVSAKMQPPLLDSPLVELSHTVDYVSQNQNFDQILRILPDKRIYNIIYNNFTKKLLLEQCSTLDLSTWKNNLILWYDICYANIVEYFDLISTDVNTNVYPEIINFDLITDKDYMELILKKYFDINISQNQINVIEKYKSLQLSIALEQDQSKDMKTIVEPITDQLLKSMPWFFAYCMFKYERNNQLTELDRLWSVNNFNRWQNRQDLIALAEQYQRR
jgi:hypothetical protein